MITDCLKTIVSAELTTNLLNKQEKTEKAYENNDDTRITPYQERVIEYEKLLVRWITPLCFKCGADINLEEINWMEPDTVRCFHYRAALAIEFERVQENQVVSTTTAVAGPCPFTLFIFSRISRICGTYSSGTRTRFSLG